MEFKMPRGPVSIKAIYKEKHKVTVNGGKSNVKEGKEGTVVTVNTEIKDFDHWEFETDEVLMANPKNRETSFLMPNSDVKLKAVAKKER